MLPKDQSKRVGTVHTSKPFPSKTIIAQVFWSPRIKHEVCTAIRPNRILITFSSRGVSVRSKALTKQWKQVRTPYEGFRRVYSAVENVRDLNVRLIDMARASTDVAFDFAHAVAAAKKPSDFVEAWTTHATKQFDMLTKASG